MSNMIRYDDLLVWQAIVAYDHTTTSLTYNLNIYKKIDSLTHKIMDRYKTYTYFIWAVRLIIKGALFCQISERKLYDPCHYIVYLSNKRQT